MGGAGFCHRCGTPLWERATMCSRCGETVASANATIEEEPTTARMGQSAPRPGPVGDPQRVSEAEARGPITERMPFGTTLPVVAVHTITQIDAPAPEAPSDAAERRPRPAMTMIAGEGFAISERFNLAFLDAFPGWTAELTAPVGPSTGGGELAQQSITLVSPQGQRVAVGRVDPGRRTVTVRGHDVVRVMFTRRFEASLPLAADAYERFLERLGRFFTPLGFAIARETLAPIDSLAPPAPTRPRTLVYLVALTAVLVLAVVAFLVASR